VAIAAATEAAIEAEARVAGATAARAAAAAAVVDKTEHPAVRSLQ